MAEGRQFDHSRYERWIDPKEVVPYERNAKKHDKKQVRNIANSIRRFGWQQDVVITKDNVLVIGHGRRLAALMLGCEMPYHVVDKKADELTEEDIRELRIIDNATNESPWDLDLRALESLDLSFEGFDFGDVVEEEEKKKQTEKTVAEMQIKTFEHHDYIVFVFDNQFDWINAASAFGLERVDAGYGQTKKIGIGRVLHGKRLLEKIGHQDSHPEPGKVEDDKDS